MPPNPVPIPSQWPIPKLILTVEDLNHEGAKLFFKNIAQPHDAMREAVLSSFTTLYTPENVPRSVEQITLILRDMEGIAYTCDGADTHKEIHFALNWIKKNAHRAKDEIMGVLTHEVVHCYQYNALSTCPGGLIEGIADFVRLHADLSPPHWHRTAPTKSQKWDAGYERTAYFLDWIDNNYGRQTISSLNLGLQSREYDELIFKELTGVPLSKLWELYCASFQTIKDVSNPGPPCVRNELSNICDQQVFRKETE